MSNLNLEKIYNLVKEYSKLDKGVLIENHLEKIHITKIPSLSFAKSQNVYISRRATKHFVERRYEEFSKRNSPETTLTILKNMVFALENVFLDFDNAILDKGGADIIFEKRSMHNNFIIRIVVENRDDGLHVKTIHPKQIPPSQSVKNQTNKKSHKT